MACALDGACNVALLEGGEAGDATWEDFTRVCDEAGEDFHVVVCQREWVFAYGVGRIVAHKTEQVNIF